MCNNAQPIASAQWHTTKIPSVRKRCQATGGAWLKLLGHLLVEETALTDPCASISQLCFGTAGSPEKDSLERSTASVESLSDDIDVTLPVSGWRVLDPAFKPTQLLQLEQLRAKRLHSTKHDIWRVVEGPH